MTSTAIFRLKDPWDFKEVYSKFYDYSKQPCFHEEKTAYYIHMSARFDEFDLVQFANVVMVCRTSDTAADAAKKLFAVTRKAKKSNNDSDRLTKYLSRFGVKFKDIR